MATPPWSLTLPRGLEGRCICRVLLPEWVEREAARLIHGSDRECAAVACDRVDRVWLGFGARQVTRSFQLRA
jgi:hypothetical protein